jgi:outer membrane lipoprotein carrier protein
MKTLMHPTIAKWKAAIVTGFAACAAWLVVNGAAAQTTPPPSGAADVGQAVASVQAFYNRSNTFKSDFEQRFWVKAYNHEKSSRGHVTFAKPGKMDWKYTDPQDNRVVSDGTVIRVYDAANKQMYEQPVNTTQYPTALSFLTGGGNLVDTFSFELFPGDQLKFPGGYVLVGTPKDPTPAYAKVLFYVDAATSQVRRVMLIDGQGNRNRFDFVDPRINEPVAAGDFKFTPPPGTSIVRP